MKKIPLSILIIEDTPEWANDIRDAFDAVAPNLGFSLTFDFAENLREAEEKSKSLCFHGISTDQNMPETVGGDVSRDHGKEYIRNLQSWDPPAYMAVYTAYPHTTVSNIAGQKGIQDYITKSDENTTDEAGHLHMRVTAYASYFLSKIEVLYIQRVLKLAQDSGISDLRSHGRKASIAFDDFTKSNRTIDEKASQFIVTFFALQECFNRILIAFFKGIAGTDISQQILGEIREESEAGKVEVSLRKMLNGLENRGMISVLAVHLGLRKPRNISGHYIDSCKAIREVRNKATHSTWNINVKSYQDLRSDVISVCDLLAWFLRRPMIISPFRTRDYFVRVVDVRRQFPENREFYFEHEVPDAKPYELYTMLSQDGPFLQLTSFLTVETDEATGDPTLMVNR